MTDTINLETLYLSIYKRRQYKTEALNDATELLLKARELRSELFSELIEAFIDDLSLKRKDALAHALKAVDIDPQSALSWHAVGSLRYANQDDAIAEECYKKAIELDPGLAIAWNGLGIVYNQQRKNTEAMDCFNKAIELDESFFAPISNLGHMFRRSKDYDKAIIYYNKVLSFDANLPSALNGLGNVYRILGDFSKALEYYERALQIDPNRLLYLKNISNTCKKMGNLSVAITYCKRIIELEPTPRNYEELGELFVLIKDYNQAKKSFSEALSQYQANPNPKQKNYQTSRIEALIINLDEKIETLSIIENKNDLRDSDPVVQILVETFEQGIQEKALKNQTSFINFIRQKPLNTEINNVIVSENSDSYFPDERDEPSIYFEVLRRWNSYTPIIADNFHISKGGGYFLKTNDIGIVIDPGFNFIENFKGASHFFYEIDHIFISHAHNDHTADLESILTLLWKYNQEIKGLDVDCHDDNTIRSDIAKSQDKPIESIKEKEIEETFLLSKRRKQIDLYITNSVFKKYSGLFDILNSTNYKIHVIESENSISIDESLTIKVIGAKHHDIISDNSSVGFIFNFKNSMIVYTGDTGWDDDKIKKQYQTVRDSCKEKNIILVAHIGGFKEYEMNYLSPRPPKDKPLYYKNHLGRIGMAKLLQILKPKICFISEFGEEFKGYRIKITDIFQKNFPNTKFFPADIGLQIDPINETVRAVHKVDLDSYLNMYKFLDPQRIKCCELRKDYSLHFFDDYSDFSESDLIQVLAEQFDNGII